MHIEHLSLTNFRNYARLELSLPQQPVVLHGDNAQGKTSLLEAIYYLATSKSPYTTSDRQLIHWRTDNDPIPYARMIAEFSNQQSPLQRMEVTLMMDKASGATRFKKTIKVNNVEKRVMDVVGMLNVVLFVPRDLSLIEGSPADRRRFMDITFAVIGLAIGVCLLPLVFIGNLIANRGSLFYKQEKRNSSYDLND